MQSEFTKAIVFSIFALIFGGGVVVISIHPKCSVFQNVRGCFVFLGVVLLIGAICVFPVEVESYEGEVTILKTENVGSEWNVYFNDNGEVRSIRCTEQQPWYAWNEGDVKYLKYGRINSLYNLTSNSSHYQMIV